MLYLKIDLKFGNSSVEVCVVLLSTCEQAITHEYEIFEETPAL